MRETNIYINIYNSYFLIISWFQVVPNPENGSNKIVGGATVTDPADTYYFASIAVF